jgi:hypothetical protein
MFFKVRDMLNSAKISPETSEKDVKDLMKSFFYMMMKSDKNSQSQNEEEMQKQMEDEEGKQEKNSITGNIIFKLN